MRIVQISDTHLTHRGGVTNRNFDQLVHFLNDVLRPDLIVNTGDVAILSPDSAADREAARALHDRFIAPVRVLPGNHDVGEAGEHPWAGIAVTSERVQAFRSSFGHDHWLEILPTDADATPQWAVIGINSEILSSGLPEEAEQWAWLENVAAEVLDRPTLLFMHKPMWSPLEIETEHALSITPADRERLRSVLGQVDLRVVGSGHLHRYSVSRRDDITAVLAPSTAFVVRASMLGDGLEQLGVVEYVIDDRSVTPMFRSVPSLEEGEPWNEPEFAEAWTELDAGPLPTFA